MMVMLAILAFLFIAGTDLLPLIGPTAVLLLVLAGLMLMVGARRTAESLGKLVLAIILGGFLLPPLAEGLKQDLQGQLGFIKMSMVASWLPLMLLLGGLLPFALWRLRGRRIPERELFAPRTHAAPVNAEQEEGEPWAGQALR